MYNFIKNMINILSTNDFLRKSFFSDSFGLTIVNVVYKFFYIINVVFNWSSYIIVRSCIYIVLKLLIFRLFKICENYFQTIKTVKSFYNLSMFFSMISIIKIVGYTTFKISLHWRKINFSTSPLSLTNSYSNLSRIVRFYDHLDSLNYVNKWKVLKTYYEVYKRQWVILLLVL